MGINLFQLAFRLALPRSHPIDMISFTNPSFIPRDRIATAEGSSPATTRLSLHYFPFLFCSTDARPSNEHLTSWKCVYVQDTPLHLYAFRSGCVVWPWFELGRIGFVMVTATITDDCFDSGKRNDQSSPRNSPEEEK